MMLQASSWPSLHAWVLLTLSNVSASPHPSPSPRPSP